MCVITPGLPGSPGIPVAVGCEAGAGILQKMTVCLRKKKILFVGVEMNKTIISCAVLLADLLTSSIQKVKGIKLLYPLPLFQNCPSRSISV